ncbi:peptidase M23-like protein [Knoellia remsis]|uniref:Peptidase M23-like protein n=1 Tax=Knoellia remsis TaxID=407159 RepID=A0A2T0UZG5_9MICO|nr:M23 family metallopeptidase [Knoellia remsis]PRY63323.1 peptidase M23-like protein [Knoellia remsis]
MDTVSSSAIIAALRRAATVLTLAGSLAPAGVITMPDPGPTPVAAGGSLAPARIDPASLRGTWEWPLSPRPRVLAPYRAPASTYGAGHRGIDLSANQGQQVGAVDDGVVTHVGIIAGRGTVTVTHTSGLRSTYEPVAGAVTTGQRVASGQRLGVVRGRTHCGGSCLHLGALTESSPSGYTDPRPLLGGSRVILLPQGTTSP